MMNILAWFSSSGFGSEMQEQKSNVSEVTMLPNPKGSLSPLLSSSSTEALSLVNKFQLKEDFDYSVNGKLKSAEHRVITNSTEVRTTIATIQGFQNIWYKSEIETMNCDSKNWYKVQSVPEKYVFPPETRPGGNETPLCKASPVIDLKMDVGQHDQDLVIKQILEASESFGFFQVINHGVSGKVMEEAQEIFKEFFSMEAEEKVKAINGSGLIYTSNTGFALDGVHLWRENLKQPCHPLEKCMQFFPDKPAKYREVMPKYLDEVKKLSLRILELISEGLGLEPSFFNELSELQLMSANYYPPCPDPSLTLGIPKHTDPSLVTILLGDASGLQMLKDGQWIEVEPVANGFVVNIGNQLQVISNGKLKSPEHRVVTNQSEARTSIAAFVNPSASCVVEPAKALVDASPPRFGAVLYKDFIKSIGAFGPDTEAIVNQLAG